VTSLRDELACVQGEQERCLPLSNGSSAARVTTVNVSDEILDFLVEQIPTQRLADFKVSDGARQRVWNLVAREKESGLLPGEKVELEDYLKLEHLVVLAKAKALAPRHG
jgi:hypothetical protein